MTLEELLEKGFSRDDIMYLAEQGALNGKSADAGEGEKTAAATPEDQGKPDAGSGDKVKTDASAGDISALTILSQVLENQNKMMLAMMESKKTEPDQPKEPTPDENARKYSDEHLVKALQSLNILKDGDTIDIGSAVEKNIEDKILGKLGMAVGFTVKKDDKSKEG